MKKKYKRTFLIEVEFNEPPPLWMTTDFLRETFNWPTIGFADEDSGDEIEGDVVSVEAK